MRKAKLKRFLATTGRQAPGVNRKGKPVTHTHTRHWTIEAATIEAAREIAGPGATVERKRKPRARSTLVATPRPRDSKAHASAQAVEYAKWLAARDRIALPDGFIVGRVLWANVLRDDGKLEPRPFRVTLGTMVESSNKARLIFSPAAEIDLPNWDWQPAPPVDLSEPESLAA